MDKLKMKTNNIIQKNISKIKELFPNAIKEICNDDNIEYKIDFDILKQELSSNLLDESKERYQLSWPDKKKSLLLANSRTNATLRPLVNKSVNFDNTKNIYIEGDNLETLKCLQETYLHKIDVIYIDPPYNTGKNYIYKNDYSIRANDFYQIDSQLDVSGNRLTQNQESNGRFHTDWLNMMYPRLKIAKNLLTDDGVLVVAIDENELPTLAMMLKEIFGESQYDVTYTTVVHNPRGQQGNNFSYVNEFAIFVYRNDKKVIGYRKIEEDKIEWSPLRNWGSESERTDAKNCFYPIIVENEKIIGFGDVCNDNFHPHQTEIIDGKYYVYPIDIQGVERKWRYARQSVEQISNLLKVKKTQKGYDILLGKDFETQKTLWNDSLYDASVYGSQLVQKLLNLKDGFSFPKSLWLVYDTINCASSKKDSIILDFFSGSATTAHAVMELNKNDGGNRKFILVQIPQACDAKEEAIKKGYATICDIGEERIRKAGEKIVEENPYLANNLDIGFRVFKLDSSNMQDVYYNPNLMTQNLLELTVDNVKSDRTSLDLLFQVMLELGIELSAKIENRIINNKYVYYVNDNDIIACFEDDIDDDVIKNIANALPVYAVFKAKSFATDSVSINNEQLFKTYSPNTIVKVL